MISENENDTNEIKQEPNGVIESILDEVIKVKSQENDEVVEPVPALGD